MKLISSLCVISCFVFITALQSQTPPITPYEKSGKTQTATYQECIAWYKQMHKLYPKNTRMDSIGLGDAGKAIYVFEIVGESTDITIGKSKLLINNNIHPGEPEGTDASMLLVRNLLTKTLWSNYLRNLEIHIVCQYNVDGTLNRTCCSRANQDGPLEYGFRANARNLDLNRDFIKCDSRNAKTFVNYFVANKFHFLIDNHTSDGADYQHTLTYFYTRPEKLNPSLNGSMLRIDSLLYLNLKARNILTVPYVETIKNVPDSGIHAFWETGRYATGFAALHNCIGFTVETHMLKPFSDRVEVTQAFLEEFIKSINLEKFVVQNTFKKIGDEKNSSNSKMYLNHTLDLKKHDWVRFQGYAPEYVPSGVTGQNKLVYNHSKPYDKQVPYYKYFTPTDSVKLPKYYIVPFAFSEVIERLKLNGIKMTPLKRDSFVKASFYYIKNYETVKYPYENHYLHYNISTIDTVYTKLYFSSDVKVEVTPENSAFLAAVLEPRAPDSYFAWNYFDGILMQKEWFSDYVFEDKAFQILNENPVLKAAFEKKKTEETEFKNNAQAQLIWVYRNSYYYEKSHNLYPVARIY